MDNKLFKVAFDNHAIYIPDADTSACEPSERALGTVIGLHKFGIEPDERLLHALSHLDSHDTKEINDCIRELLGADYNWVPLVRDWQKPIGTGPIDALVTAFVNALPQEEQKEIAGTRLPCGHLIPDGTFPLERYNGCPFCGTPFVTANRSNEGQGTVHDVYTVWTDADLRQHLDTLLASKTPLEGNGRVQLDILLRHLGLPANAVITIRETAVMAFIALTDLGRYGDAADLIQKPSDILRALWYAKTGSLRIESPKALLKRAGFNAGYIWQDNHEQLRDNNIEERKASLRLHYSRGMCKFIAGLFEHMDMSVEQMCEDMHPRRQMWVRFIRALRLTEFARKAQYPQLRELLDRFYRQDYDVWAGEVETALLDGNSDRALELLSQRPGEFARRLFSTMLRIGYRNVLAAFAKVADNVPLPLIISLDSYAPYYFDPECQRSARLASGKVKILGPNQLLEGKSATETADMIAAVKSDCTDIMRRRLASRGKIGGTVYIDPQLFDTPLPVGERSQNDAGANYLPQGTQIPVEGDKVRLFLHWGVGMPAQHYDLDLSAVIQYPDHTEECAFYNLDSIGAEHSGDIQYIPDKVGAAEYIELDIPVLEEHGARYVAFLSNCYTPGGVGADVTFGWMSCEYPMTVNNKTGVAYDPSTVQFSTTTVMSSDYDCIVFGLLDLKKRAVVWLEMLLNSQTAHNFKIEEVLALYKKLKNRMTAGEFLALRAEAQGQKRVDNPDGADEKYTCKPADFVRITALL